MSIQGISSTKVEVFKSAGGNEQSVVYTAPDGTTCTLRVSVGTKLSASVTLLDYTCENDDDDGDGEGDGDGDGDGEGEETWVDVSVKAETTGSGLKRMGPHKINNTGSALEVVEDKAAGQFVIVYGVPPVRMGAMFVSPVKELDMLIVAHIYGTSKQSFSVVAKISCDGAKGLTYHMTEPTQHSSTEEALQAIRDILERREDTVFETNQKDNITLEDLAMQKSDKAFYDCGSTWSREKCHYPNRGNAANANANGRYFGPRLTFDSLNIEDCSARPRRKNTGRIDNRGGSNRGDFNNSVVNINIFADAVERNLRPKTRRSLPSPYTSNFEVGLLPWESTIRRRSQSPSQPVFTRNFNIRFLPWEYDSFFDVPKFRWF